MIDHLLATQIPRLLAEPLLAAIAAGRYAEYLNRVYQHRTPSTPSSSVVYAVEVDGIDVPSGRLSSVPVQWWRVDPSEAHPIDAPDMAPFNAASERRDTLYPAPLLKFFVDWPGILCLESVGPLIRRCRVLTVAAAGDRLDIEADDLLWLANYPDQVMVGVPR